MAIIYVLDTSKEFQLNLLISIIQEIKLYKSRLSDFVILLKRNPEGEEISLNEIKKHAENFSLTLFNSNDENIKTLFEEYFDQIAFNKVKAEKCDFFFYKKKI